MASAPMVLPVAALVEPVEVGGSEATPTASSELLSALNDPASLDREIEALEALASEYDEDADDLGPQAVALPDAITAKTVEQPLIDLDTAMERLGDKVIAILDERFKGKVVGVRQLDARDLIF